MNQKGEDKSLKSTIAQREEEILEFWNKNKIFEKTLEKESPNGNFVFFDGPPFATGLPHYGHVLPGTIKDVIPRYQTMKGKRVLRRWGWDCHGLPIENLIEKELDLKSKKDIENYGVEKFNKAARGAVFRYRDEWKKIIPRSGRWVDMDNDYRTMDSSYTESVWWSFKTLYEKGLIYKDFKSMLLCPHCETTLSNFEVNQGYKDITDISVYVEFELLDMPKTYLIAWTTTPWTLPGNVALVVNKSIEYVAIEGEVEGNTYIIAKERVAAVFKTPHKILRSVDPKELIGKSYKPVFDYYQNVNIDNKENGWKVYHGDFVTTESGTGIVHIAPAFGEDDMNLGKKENLPFVQHVNRDGTFKSEIVDFAGERVKPKDDHQKVDVEVIKYLAKKDFLFAKEKIVHSYPHCWRCDTPLLNYATDSWFVKVTAMKDKLVELNKKVSWTPEEIGDGRFGKWLEGARDWAISRSRYWGAPLPVWVDKEGKFKVLGSVEELNRFSKKSGNKYFVMRHGQAENNVSEKIILKNDDKLNLTDFGKKQVEESTENFKEKIDLVFCSTYQRSKQTAKILCEKSGFDFNKVVFDDRIHEWEIASEFEGKGREMLRFYESDYLKTPTKKFVDGESFADVVKRAGEFIYELELKYKDKNILIVSHSGTGRALSFVAEGNSFEGLKNKFLEPLRNSEIRELKFTPLPHNQDYELDLHRPYIDEIEIIDERSEAMTRVPEIFDTWYDSGSMPFAQQHYPFENKEEFDRRGNSLFPADFIAEGLDQTRGWFYTLLVLGAGLFERSPYQKVLVNGLVLAEDGKKMSKKLKNYPDLMDIVNKYGADSMRYYLMASPLVKAEDFNFSEKGVDEVSKKLVQKVYNVLSFYEMYPIVTDLTPQPTILDTWILSKLNELNRTISDSLEKYEIDKAARPIVDFVDDLSTWYLRRSRDRFKSEDVIQKKTASYYTGFVLREFSKIIAPFTPFIADYLYRKVAGDKESVHLCDWPEGGEIDTGLIDEMNMVRDIVTKSLEKRQNAGIKVRQPLNILKVKNQKPKLSEELLEIVKDEVNVKKVIIDENIEGDVWLDTDITEDLKEEGVARDIIRAIQDIRKNEGLNPSQSISVVFCVDKDIQVIIDKYSEIIRLPTGIKELTSVSEKQKHTIVIDSVEISISIKIV